MKVGILTASSGEYDEYRSRNCAVYEDRAEAKIEAERRNKFVQFARDRAKDIDWDTDYDKAEKRAERQLKRIRRETRDKEISSHQEVYDLQYSVDEVEFIR